MRTRFLLAATLLLAAAARADVAPEAVGEVARTPERWGAHYAWIGDMLLRKSALFDADTGRVVGTLYGGNELTPLLPLTNVTRREVYLASTFYSRRTRGERTDVLTIFDAGTLAPKGEVVLPPKRASNGNGVALSALLDGGRFALVWNQTPANSVSVVDVVARKLASEIATGGCGLVYPAGPRTFGMLCLDGSVLAVTLDDAGAEVSRSASAKFFDAARDPLTEKGVRIGGGRWLFASFDGYAHEVDFTSGPSAKPAWSLVTDSERANDWRIGGHQHLAFHAKSNRLYSLMHQGEPDTHKHAGSELWEYDLAARKKTRVIEVPNLSASGLRSLLKLPAGGAIEWVMQRAIPNDGAHGVAITPDAQPLILLSSNDSPVVAVLDAESGELVREIEDVGFAPALVVLP